MSKGIGVIKGDLPSCPSTYHVCIGEKKNTEGTRHSPHILWGWQNQQLLKSQQRVNPPFVPCLPHDGTLVLTLRGCL